MSVDTALAKELAKDYANYAKLDLSTQMKTFNDTVDDVMMRLEEFQSIITMVQAESSVCVSEHMPKMCEMRQEVNDLGKRIDALEHVIAMVNANLCTLEAAVDNAETELGVPDRLFGILNPLSFFKKSPESTVSTRLTAYESPTIYKTEAFFNKE